jgi:hypothetical protein
MGMVKRTIEDLTYSILNAHKIEDTEENYIHVFEWVMGQNILAPESELINQYQKEHSSPCLK